MYQSFKTEIEKSRNTHQKKTRFLLQRNSPKKFSLGASAEKQSFFSPFDTSELSDWECNVGGFPCRNVGSERFINDLGNHEPHVECNKTSSDNHVKSEH